jgi:hypothetical protein
VREVEPGLLFDIIGEPVKPTMPRSAHTLGAPTSNGAAPPVLCETTSLSAPGSLPCVA